MQAMSTVTVQGHGLICRSWPYQSSSSLGKGAGYIYRIEHKLDGSSDLARDMFP